MTLYAKSDKETLFEHSIKVYNAGLKIIDMLPYSKNEREELKKLSSLPLLFHDIGKGAVGFQKALINGANWGGLRHEILSAAFLGNLNIKDEQIFAVITHHKDILYSEGKKILPSNQLEDNEILNDMKKQFEENSEEIKFLCDKLIDYAKLKINYSIKLDKGIGINMVWLNGKLGWRYGQCVKINLENKKLAAKLRGILRAADHLASAHKEPIDQINMKEYVISKYPLRYFQRRCKECNEDIMLIAPTGSGKTEAVLLWAQSNQKENSRLFYVLPYQASINAMHERLSKIFDKNYVGILHSNSVSYLYNSQGEDKNSLADNQKEAQNMAALAKEIYYPIRICTPHQLLRFGLKGTGWEFLFLEFSNSLVIYDEIHAFQPQIVGLTLATAKLLKNLGAKLAFASATFPDFLKSLIKEKLGEMIEITPAKQYNQKEMTEDEYNQDQYILNRKRHIVEVLDGNLIDNLDKIIQTIDDDKSVLIIANHVKTAQKIYEILSDYKPMLLHSRFNKKDRRNKEQMLISNGQSKPKIVIATQVIEVSLDIDYQAMFTEPAPIDALAQRFGRINRKGDRKPESIYVMSKQISPHNIYIKERVGKTIELLKNIINPVSEMGLLDITNKVYSNGYTTEEMEYFNLGFNNYGINNFEKNFTAGVSRKWVEDVVDKNDGNCEVLPINYYDEYENKKEQGLWVEAKDLLVNVRYNLIFDKITNKNDENSDVIIVDCKYDSERGLLTEEKTSNFIGLD